MPSAFPHFSQWPRPAPSSPPLPQSSGVWLGVLPSGAADTRFAGLASGPLLVLLLSPSFCLIVLLFQDCVSSGSFLLSVLVPWVCLSS